MFMPCCGVGGVWPSGDAAVCVALNPARGGFGSWSLLLCNYMTTVSTSEFVSLELSNSSHARQQAFRNNIDTNITVITVLLSGSYWTCVYSA